MLTQSIIEKNQAKPQNKVAYCELAYTIAGCIQIKPSLNLRKKLSNVFFNKNGHGYLKNIPTFTWSKYTINYNIFVFSQVASFC